MKKLWMIPLGIAIAAVTLVVAQLTGLNLAGKEADSKFQNKGELEVICELENIRPVNGLDQPPEVTKLTLPAKINFEDNTGWYMGEYTISANRKGTLTVKGAILEVSRPAMFSRYGLSVMGEHFTLDRSNGQFQQWLDIKGEKKLKLLSGTCKRTTDAPF
jgi:hypothetical protein